MSILLCKMILNIFLKINLFFLNKGYLIWDFLPVISFKKFHPAIFPPIHQFFTINQPKIVSLNISCFESQAKVSSKSLSQELTIVGNETMKKRSTERRQRVDRVISVRRGVSKRVNMATGRPPCDGPWDGQKSLSRVPHPKGVEGSGMSSPGETLSSSWPPLGIRPWTEWTGRGDVDGRGIGHWLITRSGDHKQRDTKNGGLEKNAD
jgi:hypothetical protein